MAGLVLRPRPPTIYTWPAGRSARPAISDNGRPGSTSPQPSCLPPLRSGPLAPWRHISAGRPFDARSPPLRAQPRRHVDGGRRGDGDVVLRALQHGGAALEAVEEGVGYEACALGEYVLVAAPR